MRADRAAQRTGARHDLRHYRHSVSAGVIEVWVANVRRSGSGRVDRASGLSACCRYAFGASFCRRNLESGEQYGSGYRTGARLSGEPGCMAALAAVAAGGPFPPRERRGGRARLAVRGGGDKRLRLHGGLGPQSAHCRPRNGSVDRRRTAARASMAGFAPGNGRRRVWGSGTGWAGIPAAFDRRRDGCTGDFNLAWPACMGSGRDGGFAHAGAGKGTCRDGPRDCRRAAWGLDGACGVCGSGWQAGRTWGVGPY